MARERSSEKIAKSRKEMWHGNSEELMIYLRKKSIALTKILKETDNQNDKEKIRGFINVIDEVLKLKYFGYYPIVGMISLINAVKDDREKLLDELDAYKNEHQGEISRLESELQEALCDSDFYYANSFEEEYESEKQKKLRESSQAYEEAKFDYDMDIAVMEHRIKVFDWLQGIIHHPVNFFKNAYSDGK